MKTQSKILNPNPFHIWLNLFFGPNHQKVILEKSWDRSTKLRQYYRIECFDEHREGTGEELHQEVAELHVRKRQIIDFKGKETEWENELYGETSQDLNNFKHV